MSASQSWREDAALPGDGDVEREMMTSELQHPGSLFRGRSEDRNVVEIFAEHRAAAHGRAVAAGPGWWTIAAGRWTISSVCSGRARRTAGTGVGLPEDLIAFHDLLDFFKTLRAQRGRYKGHRCGTLSGIHFLEADPPRGTKPVGKLDQRARCCSSSKEKRTVCRCFSVSVERKVFAARTMRAVAVCAETVITDNQIAATAAMVRSILMGKRFTLLSLSVVLVLNEAISRDRKIFQEDRSRCRDFRLSLSTLIDVVFLFTPTLGKEISSFAGPLETIGMMDCT